MIRMLPGVDLFKSECGGIRNRASADSHLCLWTPCFYQRDWFLKNMTEILEGYIQEIADIGIAVHSRQCCRIRIERSRGPGAAQHRGYRWEEFVTLRFGQIYFVFSFAGQPVGAQQVCDPIGIFLECGCEFGFIYSEFSRRRIYIDADFCIGLGIIGCVTERGGQ